MRRIKNKSEFIYYEAEASDQEASSEEIEEDDDDDFVDDRSTQSGISINYATVSRAMPRKRSVNVMMSSDDEDEDAPPSPPPPSPVVSSDLSLTLPPPPLTTPSAVVIDSSNNNKKNAVVEINMPDIPKQLVKPYDGGQDDVVNPGNYPETAMTRETTYNYKVYAVPCRVNELRTTNIDPNPQLVRKARKVHVSTSDYLYVDMYGERIFTEKWDRKTPMPSKIRDAKKALRRKYPVFANLTPGLYWSKQFNIITSMNEVQFVVLSQTVREESSLFQNNERSYLDVPANFSVTQNKRKALSEISGNIAPKKKLNPMKKVVASCYPIFANHKQSALSENEHIIAATPKAHCSKDLIENVKISHEKAKRTDKRFSEGKDFRKRKLDLFVGDPIHDPSLGNTSSDPIPDEIPTTEHDSSITFICEIKGTGEERDEAESDENSEEELSKIEKEPIIPEGRIEVEREVEVESEVNAAQSESGVVESESIEGKVLVVEQVISVNISEKSCFTHTEEQLNEMLKKEDSTGNNWDLSPILPSVQDNDSIPDDGNDDVFINIDSDCVAKAKNELSMCSGEIFPSFFRYPFDLILQKYGRQDEVKDMEKAEWKASDMIKLFRESNDWEQVESKKLMLVETPNMKCPVALLCYEEKGPCKGNTMVWTIEEMQSFLSTFVKLFHNGTKMIMENIYNEKMAKIIKQGNEITTQIGIERNEIAKLCVAKRSVEENWNNIASLRLQLETLGKERDKLKAILSNEMDLVAVQKKELRFMKEGDWFIRVDE